MARRQHHCRQKSHPAKQGDLRPAENDPVRKNGGAQRNFPAIAAKRGEKAKLLLLQIHGGTRCAHDWHHRFSCLEAQVSQCILTC